MVRRQPLQLVDARGPRDVETPLLVVEDDAQLCSLMVMLLEEEGYPVEVAIDGRQAVQRASATRPSLVILDLGLPYLDGQEVGAQLRARYGEGLPLIVVTADRQGAERAAALGAAYLRKPFDLDALLLLIARHLDQG